MADDTDLQAKKNSMENFVEPDEVVIPDSDEASIFMKKRRRQHKRYLKTARNAQKVIEQLSEQEANLDALGKANQSQSDKE